MTAVKVPSQRLYIWMEAVPQAICVDGRRRRWQRGSKVRRGEQAAGDGQASA